MQDVRRGPAGPVTYACLDVLQLSKVSGILIRQSVVADLAEMTKA